MRKAGEPGNEDGERAYIVARFYLGSRRGNGTDAQLGDGHWVSSFKNFLI